jgi:hypothetical protein
MKMTKNAKTKRLSALAAAVLVLGGLASAAALAGDAIGSHLERLDAGQSHWHAAETKAAPSKSQKAMSQSVDFTDSEDGLSAPTWSSKGNTDRFERFSNGAWNYRRGR